MNRPTTRNLVFGAVFTVGAAVALAKCRLERATADRVDTLLSSASAQRKLAFRSTDVAELPDPVRRYFDAVIKDGRRHVRSARLEQCGEFLLGSQSGTWKPMRATQHYTVSPPGFVWDAAIEVVPFVSARVVDAYERGQGSLRATVLSTIPVAAVGPSLKLNEGELVRYLAEAVWFPTALLPTAGVTWDSIDDQSARATIEDHGNTASLVFHFGEDGLVKRVHTPRRYRQEDDAFVSWTGYFEEYQWHDGMQIPTAASVEWNSPDGALPYWCAQITAVDYR